MALSIFFQASCSWQSEGLFGQYFSIALAVQALRQLPCLGSFSVPHQTHRGAPLGGVLLCRLACWALKGGPWVGSYSVVQCVRHLIGQPLYCSAADAGLCGKRLWWWLHPVHVTQQYHLASMAAWLSSTGISPPWSPPSHPLDCICTVNSSPSPGIAPQSLNSSSQPLHLLGTCIPVWGMYGCGKDCLILIPFRLPQISCFTLGLKCFSFDSDNCPDVGIRLLLQFPHPPKVGPVLLTLLFFPLIPSSYWVLRGLIFSFPLVRYSYLLSAGVLHALLCVKVYSWRVHGERCTPCPPIPPPSCSFEIFVFKKDVCGVPTVGQTLF